MTAQELYNERQQLIEDSLACKNNTRVVNGTRVNYWPFLEYGMTLADAMRDYDRVNECFIRYHKEFAPDVGSMCVANQPSKVFEITGSKVYRWPGDAKGLDVNAPYQYIEFETMMEDEYDELLENPAQFAITKFMPRTNTIFEPLTNLNWQLFCTQGGMVNAFTTPPMIEMYKKLIEVSEINNDYQMHCGILKKTLMEMGYPFISGATNNMAFDMVADSLRCTMGFFADLIIQPENVRRTLDIFVDYHIQSALGMCKMMGSKYAWTMLHKAFDGFISDDDYREFYWPYLKKWALAMIDNGIIPVFYTEGPYTTRLKYLAELPERKCLISFEDVDFEQAAKLIGGKNCMMGGFANQDLMYCTPEQIREKVKRILDIMAPTGGYIFGMSASIDHAPRANMEALFQAVQDFGKY